MKQFKECAECGMLLTSNAEYHPYAACVMYRQTQQAEKVNGWLASIVQYGMSAQEQGISLSVALQDISKVAT